MDIVSTTVHEIDLDHEGDRVRKHTAHATNHRIDKDTRDHVQTTLRGGPAAIAARLDAIATEWDVDRALMANFAILGGAAFVTGITQYATSSPFRAKRKGFLYLFGAQLGFLLLHATVGWCPPLPVLRRLGFRTAREIESERRTLERALISPR